jgi:hypothetical protein
VVNDALGPALARFVRSVALLALPAEEQTRWLNSFGLPGEAALADELALEFDDGFLLLPQFVEQGWLPDRLAEHLCELDKLLAAMSEPEKAEIWDISALATAEEWTEVRRHAASVLFGL